ncbi:hypothetical protein ACLKA7_014969 [Drosophila subpalustris]
MAGGRRGVKRGEGLGQPMSKSKVNRATAAPAAMPVATDHRSEPFQVALQGRTRLTQQPARVATNTHSERLSFLQRSNNKSRRACGAVVCRWVMWMAWWLSSYTDNNQDDPEQRAAHGLESTDGSFIYLCRRSTLAATSWLRHNQETFDID